MASYRAPSSGGTDQLTFNLAYPAGVVVGDMLVLVLVGQGNASGAPSFTSITDGSGSAWTLLGAERYVNGSTDSRVRFYYKDYAGTSQSTVTWGASFFVGQGYGMVAVQRDLGQQLFVDVSSQLNNDTAETTPDVADVTAPRAGLHVAMYGLNDPGATSTPPSGMTERVEISGNTGLGISTLGVSAGATGAKSWTLSLSRAWSSMSLVIGEGSPFERFGAIHI